MVKGAIAPFYIDSYDIAVMIACKGEEEKLLSRNKEFPDINVQKFGNLVESIKIWLNGIGYPRRNSGLGNSQMLLKVLA